MKSAVFVHAGLGNALLLLPLIRTLQEEKHRITLVVTSPWPCEELFRDAEGIEAVAVLNKNREHIAWGLRHVRAFDRAYLDFFAATRKNLLLAQSIAGRVHTNHWPDRNMPQFAGHNIQLLETLPGLHEGAQNLRLHNANASDSDLSIADFSYPGTPPGFTMLSGTVATAVAGCWEQPFVALQVSAGNNQTPYKNWPPHHWIELLKLLSQQYPNTQFVLLGDANETAIGKRIAEKCPNAINLVGQTTIREVMAILHRASLYVGVDSGLMHLAASFGKPTVTIWGGSDPQLFGYQRIDSTRHIIVRHTLFCQPCNSWLQPNTERVTDPLNCPDFKCIRGISPQEVHVAITQLISNLQLW